MVYTLFYDNIQGFHWGLLVPKAQPGASARSTRSARASASAARSAGSAGVPGGRNGMDTLAIRFWPLGNLKCVILCRCYWYIYIPVTSLTFIFKGRIKNMALEPKSCILTKGACFCKRPCFESKPNGEESQWHLDTQNLKSYLQNPFCQVHSIRHQCHHWGSNRFYGMFPKEISINIQYKLIET